jgi:hypothetical protein
MSKRDISCRAGAGRHDRQFALTMDTRNESSGFIGCRRDCWQPLPGRWDAVPIQHLRCHFSIPIIARQVIDKNGGADETRTRDLLRDSSQGEVGKGEPK